MPEMHFTDENVKALPTPAEGQDVWFDPKKPRLLLRVNYGGKKSWLVQFFRKVVTKAGTSKHNPTTAPLGRWPNMKLSEAWEIARKYDPDAPRNKRAGGDSFKTVAEEFIRRHVEKQQLRSQYEIERCLKAYIYPEWQHLTFERIELEHVSSLLDKIEDRNGARQADYCLAIIRKLMHWYATTKKYVVPIPKGMNRSKPSERKRNRVIGGKLHPQDKHYQDEEFRTFWNVCDDMGTYGAMLKVLVLTGQREAKVAHMKWEDIDTEGVWRIPTEDREKNNPGVLQLSKAALDIIHKQPEVEGNPYVFPGRGPGPFNSFSQRKAEFDVKFEAALKKARCKLRPWVVHDLRRTAKTLMQRASVAPHVSEAVLGHKLQGVEGVYGLHDFFDEKRDALVTLAKQVNSILHPTDGSNVHKLSRRAG
jgi:integrase